MERYVHDENVALYKKLITESELDPSREDWHKMLLTLWAEGIAKRQEATGG